MAPYVLVWVTDVIASKQMFLGIRHAIIPPNTLVGLCDECLKMCAWEATDVIKPCMVSNACEAELKSLFLALDGFNQLPEVCFKFPFILISKSTTAFLKSQS